MKRPRIEIMIDSVVIEQPLDRRELELAVERELGRLQSDRQDSPEPFNPFPPQKEVEEVGRMVGRALLERLKNNKRGD